MLALIMLAAVPVQLSNDPVIARCAGVAIHYSEVTIEPRLIAQLPRGPRAAGLSNAELQQAVEQERLDRRMVSIALAYANDYFHLGVTATDAEKALPSRVRDEAAFRQDFASSLAVPRAAGRVLHGEDKQKVFVEMLSQCSGMTMEFFEQALTVFNSDRVIDDFLSKDQAAITRARMIEDKQATLVLRKLRAVAEDRARATNQPAEDAKAAVWSELLTAAGASILEKRFHLPSWKGLL